MKGQYSKNKSKSCKKSEINRFYSYLHQGKNIDFTSTKLVKKRKSKFFLV